MAVTNPDPPHLKPSDTRWMRNWEKLTHNSDSLIRCTEWIDHLNTRYNSSEDLIKADM